ncbi:MAG: type II toxin-antitoxin system VapC family toxin [Planctomycetes bacterium]|nr:type II toxin-antitoxin system VapC family toxin [Planctomycetota bacterium]
MHLLDSDTLSHLWANHERVVNRLRRCEDTEIGTTSITKCEVLRARCENLLKAATPEDVVKAQQRLDRSEQRLTELIVMPFDEAAGAELARLEKVQKLSKIGHADLLIASVVLANDATLVTRNLKHFRHVPDLKLVNWVD